MEAGTKDISCFIALNFLFDESYCTSANAVRTSSCLMTLMSQSEKRVRVPNYWEEIVPLYDTASFQRVFRMQSHTLEELNRNIFPYMAYSSNLHTVPHEKKVMMAVYYFGHPDTLFQIAEKFDVGEATVKRCVDTLSDALVAYAAKVIKWPNRTSRQENILQFQQLAGFPDVVGAIDGTHVPIKTPVKDKECYYNRKKFFSIVLQGICNVDLVFMDCFVGYPGSVHDARVFRSSDVFNKIQENTERMVGGGHLIGDCAYKLESWLITPYRDTGHITQQQRQFNYLLSATRICVERAFALLKGRYRRLKYIDMNNISRICCVIMACCVLHNHCLLHEDIGQEFIEEFEGEEQGPGAFQLRGNPRNAAIIKREQIMNRIA